MPTIPIMEKTPPFLIERDDLTIPETPDRRTRSPLSSFVVLIVHLKKYRLLRPDQWPGHLDVEVGLAANLSFRLSCTKSAVNQTILRVRAVWYSPDK